MDRDASTYQLAIRLSALLCAALAGLIGPFAAALAVQPAPPYAMEYELPQVDAVVLAAEAQAGVPDESVTTFEPGTVLVKFRNRVPDVSARFVVRASGAEPHLRSRATGMRVVKVPVGLENSVLKKLGADPNVEWAELNTFARPQGTVNDYYRVYQWHLDKVGTPLAWDKSTGNGVVIGVVDSGVNATHPDLAGQVLPGYNVVDDSVDTSDSYGHGTKVAGVLAALTNNGIGVASIAYDSHLLPVKISNRSDGIAYSSDIAKAITWEVDHGAKVINISYLVWGSSAVADAAKYANSKGATVVTSVGNDNFKTTGTSSPNLIVVGGTDQSDMKYSTSSYGERVEFWAPGVNIPTTTGTSYNYFTGTSAASPITAGILAHLYALAPSITPGAANLVLRKTSDKIASDVYVTQGYGRVNDARATRLVAAGAVDATAPRVSFTTRSGSTLMRDSDGMVTVVLAATDNNLVNKLDLSISGTSTVLGTATFPPYAVRFNADSYVGMRLSLTAQAYDLAGHTAMVKAAFSIK
jgi:thermitase